MKRLLYQYSILFLLSWISISYINAQTINDIDLIWSKRGTMPVPTNAGSADLLLLSNGNYLATSYATTYAGNNSANIVYMTEFNETGTVIRQQGITIPTIPGDAYGRAHISHPRIIETPYGFLLLVEYNHGSAKLNHTIAHMYRMRLSPNNSSGYNGGAGWSIISQGWLNHLSTTYVTGLKVVLDRTLVLQRLDTNLIAAAATFQNYNSINGAWAGVAAGILLLDNDGNISTDGRYPNKFSAFTTTGGSATLLKKDGNSVTWSDQTGNIYKSNNNGVSFTVKFQARSLNCPSCTSLSYTSNTFDYNGSTYMIGHTSIYSPPIYMDRQFTIHGWKWDANGNIATTPKPFFVLNNTSSYGAQINLQDNILIGMVNINCTVSPNTATTPVVCEATPRLIQYSLLSNGIGYQLGNPLTNNIDKLAFAQYSQNKDAIIGRSQASGMQSFGKISMCKNYKVAPLQSSQIRNSNQTTEVFNFNSSNAFSGATEKYKWEAILLKGSLDGNSAQIGDIISSGVGQNIPQLTFTSTNGAIIQIVYTSTQRYGTTTKLNCSTSQSYEIDIIPDITGSQSICLNSTPSQLSGPVIDNTRYTYQWEESFDNGIIWRPAQGVSNTQNYIPPKNVRNVKYRRITKLASAPSNSVTSNAIDITLSDNGQIDIVAIPKLVSTGSGRIIKTSLKNIGSQTINNPFYIYIHEPGGSSGNAYTVNQNIPSGSTIDIEIPITLTGDVLECWIGENGSGLANGQCLQIRHQVAKD